MVNFEWPVREDLKKYFGEETPKLKALDVTYGDCIYGLRGYMDKDITS